MDQPITNIMRAQWAADAINALPEGDAANDLAIGIVDLLANLRHLCDQNNLDFAALDESSYRNYQSEVEIPFQPR